MSRARLRTLVALALALLFPVAALAEATFVVQARGAGFSDATPVAPQGGNMATRLGDQRRAAVQHAADLWAARLDSKVPITLDVVFQKLGCGANSAVLASAGAVSLFAGISTGGADPKLYYPSALANRLAERDLAPGEPDIVVMVNTSVDDECRATVGGYYYGFDGKAGSHVDLVQVVLHELGHGLGFSSWIDLDSGQPEEGGLDVFSAHIWDLNSRRTWRELSDVERRASARNVRRLAFQGARTVKATRELLGKGLPSLSLEPAPAGFVGAVGDTGASYADIEGPVRLATNFEGCGDGGDLTGALVLVQPNCKAAELEANLVGRGALGALLAFPSAFMQPALSVSALGRVSAFPTLIVSAGDAALMRAALTTGTLRARLHWDQTRQIGADLDGRPLLFASDPVDEGSSVSHFEPLARPDLLMEPFIGAAAPHTLDLTWPLMMDLGWGPFCGNGQIDEGEECDDGDANNDAKPDACRALCTRARCGDGVVDRDEGCDDGRDNSDTLADACRTSCSAARCGDGVLDLNEQCDQGAGNSDQRPDACRADCRPARCGDGVVDRGEACDGSEDCGASCALSAAADASVPPGDEGDGATDESVWVDPWDAPRGDQGSGKKRARSSDCSVHRAARSDRVSDGGAWWFVLATVTLLGRRARARQEPS